MNSHPLFRIILCGFFTLIITIPAFSQELTIKPEDLKIEQALEGGYHLWVRKIPGLESILLTESTADPEKRLHSYSLRNPEYHPVNGDEQRLLNGEFLDTSKGLYSLIDSTPEPLEEFGEAFHIFIPYIVEYGYSWSREGQIQVLDGTWLNIRAFQKPFADYSGSFHDNPFVLRVVQKPFEGPPEDNYMPDTVETFREIAEEGEGKAILSLGHDEMLNEISDIIVNEEGPDLDLVLALDTTKSMEDDIPFLREKLVPLLEDVTKDFENFRFGIVYYKDYMEQYVTRISPFKDGLAGAQRTLNRLHVHGGRDIPEAVYEALYAAIHSFPWDAASRLIILIGDAPPHPKPRGSITKEMVLEDAKSFSIKLNAMILPQ